MSRGLVAQSDREIYSRLAAGGRHLVANFPGFTEAQRLAIPKILNSQAVLLIARTASGKTEAVMAPVLTLLSKNRWEGRPSIIYLAPTRALVNDLYDRLHTPLTGFVDVGRRTGEYREPDNQVLITTPESLDSMLVRGWKQDRHILRDVRVIVIDELHLLAESARGTQLQILLSRLDAITGQPVLRIGLSATVPNPKSMALRFLGPEASIQIGTGRREMEVNGCENSGDLPMRSTGLDPLARIFLRGGKDASSYVSVFNRLIELRKKYNGLKALVFVPSRARCDTLSAALRKYMEVRAPLSVRAHHGSLERALREETEKQMAESNEAITVSTSTLEVGIDIGDVNVVVLDGPPSSVASLLQRVGRGNRRTNSVFVLPVVHNDVEALTMASMFRCADAGDLDPYPDTAHYSVALQQLASIMKQMVRNPTRADVIQFFSSAFHDQASSILEALISDSWVTVRNDGCLVSTKKLADIMDKPMLLHGNIGGTGRLLPLVDAVTGETLAWVSAGKTADKVLVAGGSFSTKHLEDVIELTNCRNDSKGAAIKYASRAAPVGRNALRHFSRGLGFNDDELIVYDDLYFHFGGALFSRLLKLGGLNSGPLKSQEDPRLLLKFDIENITKNNWTELEALCGFGPFQSSLPLPLRSESVIRTVAGFHFTEWVQSMKVIRKVSTEQAFVLSQA